MRFGLLALVAVAAALVPSPSSPSAQRFDAVVIGSGIGGLSAGALLAKYGRKVLLVEAHEHLGGCAHSFSRGGYTLDSGPSLWAGCSAPSTSPLRQVLDAVGAETEWVTYDGWGVHDLKSSERFRMTVGPDAFADVCERFGGKESVAAWRALLEGSEPVVDAAMACPPMALRADPLGFARTAFRPYLLPAIARASLDAGAFVPDLLTGPSSGLLDLSSGGRTDFLDRWIDYLAFALSGLPADGTVGAAVAYTLGDLHRPNAVLDYPIGGSGAVADALAATVSKRPGCEVRSRTAVDEILVEKGKAVGVRLADGATVRADVVVSNADAWTTATKLLRPSPSPKIAEWQRGQAALVPTRSFVHLWVGFDASGLPDDLDCHHTVFNEGFLGPEAAPLDAEENMYIISIPTLFDAGLAPPGRHLAHVYAAATEPYGKWATMDKAAYEAAKATAAEPLWRALEAVIPDVRARAAGDLEVVGTPLTHARFNRRHRGTYGPAGKTSAGDLAGFGNGGTPVENLWNVGDSQFPGIGLPAAAASGILVANANVGVREHRRLLAELEAAGHLVAGSDWWRKPNPTARARGGRIAAGASLDETGCSTSQGS